ncbi:hypothetical protein KSP40_PGU020594 [Platanthera guangdongensis]|uniref:Ubiquitin-like domain-containing protein n=1 Tax=Platanthera guangdongensis TaxID=2320717 RepID=A0ABR2LW31_9ASPA
MDIVVETADRRISFDLEILLFTTVQEIKEMVQKHYGVPVSHQTLSFNDIILEDQRHVEHYNLLQGSRVLLHLEPAAAADSRLPAPLEPSIITVWIPHYLTRFVEFPVDTSSDTIPHLKEAIREHFHHHTGRRFPAGRTMALFLDGVELKNGDHLPLMDCGVTAGSEIEVRPLTSDMWETFKVTVAFPPAGRSAKKTVLHLHAVMNLDDTVSELRIELQMMMRDGSHQFQSPSPAMMEEFFLLETCVCGLSPLETNSTSQIHVTKNTSPNCETATQNA